MIEKLIHKRLNSFLHQSDSLFTCQFGFCNHRSTNHAVSSITEKIRQNLDEAKFACSGFLDFQKVHDTVNHEILLAKLQRYSIRRDPLNLFKSYLEDCTQFTEVNSKFSQILPIENGVPQGSVLGSLLFLIYINDLYNLVQYSDLHHLPDDTNLLYSSKSLKDINEKVNFELKNIVNWLRTNKISLNTSKTDLILFRSKREQIPKHTNYRISGQKLRLPEKQNT